MTLTAARKCVSPYIGVWFFFFALALGKAAAQADCGGLLCDS
jgi:hypothetical protein